MESIKYIIQKFSDTYLLPAVTSTFIALLYFSYKWVRTNGRKKPFTIINIFYGKDDQDSDSAILTDLNFSTIRYSETPIAVKPTTASTAVSMQLWDKSLVNKKFPMKLNINLKKSDLHRSKQIKNVNCFSNPVHKILRKSSDIKNPINSIAKYEPVWDNYDVIDPPKDLFFSKNDLFSKILEDEFYSNFCIDGDDGTRNSLNIEPLIQNSKEKSLKVANATKTVITGKHKTRAVEKYYRLVYDIEDIKDNLCDYFGGKSVNQIGSSTVISESILESLASKSNSPSSSKNILDGYEFTAVELNSCIFNEEPLKSACYVINFDKDKSEKKHVEDFWKIA